MVAVYKIYSKVLIKIYFILIFIRVHENVLLLLSDLELLPGVIPLCREHGRGNLRPLNHYLLAQLPFAFAWSILIAGLRKTQENIYRHLLNQVQ